MGFVESLQESTAVALIQYPGEFGQPSMNMVKVFNKYLCMFK